MEKTKQLKAVPEKKKVSLGIRKLEKLETTGLRNNG